MRDWKSQFFCVIRQWERRGAIAPLCVQGTHHHLEPSQDKPPNKREGTQERLGKKGGRKCVPGTDADEMQHAQVCTNRLLADSTGPASSPHHIHTAVEGKVQGTRPPGELTSFEIWLVQSENQKRMFAGSAPQPTAMHHQAPRRNVTDL